VNLNIPPILQPILILLAGAALTPVALTIGEYFKAPRVREGVCILSLAFSFLALFLLYKDILASGPAKYVFDGFFPLFGGVELYADLVSVYFSSFFIGLGLLVAVYSVRYMERDSGQDLYYTLLLTLVAGLVGVSFSGDFFNLFVFWEMMCISAYTLVTFRKERWEPSEAGFKYLVMSTLGSLLILYGISFLYGITGTVNFLFMREALTSYEAEKLFNLYPVIGMIIAGFGVTAAIVPFHTWLPDAHEAAPNSFSAMLSGVVSKAALYGIARILFMLFDPIVFNYGAVLMVFGVLSVTVGNLMALLQLDIKRILAYSSIVNIGYIITSLGIGAYAIAKYYSADPRLSLSIASLAIIGALFHVFNHTISKGLLFFCSGCFWHRARTRNLIALEGIGKKMKWTGVSLSIGLFSLAGVPPLSGFWSKLFIIASGLSVPTDSFLTTITIIIILNSIFSASYYLWLVQRIVFRKPREDLLRVKEVPVLMIAPMILLAVIIIIVGLMPGPLIGLVNAVSRVLLGLYAS
jgi:multicomponent Na+:H+ antiporter subunit D